MTSKNIPNFYIPCNYGACRKIGKYQAKNGDNFCVSCSIKVVKEDGLEFFWPHYQNAIEDAMFIQDEKAKKAKLTKALREEEEKERRESNKKYGGFNRS